MKAFEGGGEAGSRETAPPSPASFPTVTQRRGRNLPAANLGLSLPADAEPRAVDTEGKLWPDPFHRWGSSSNAQ